VGLVTQIATPRGQSCRAKLTESWQRGDQFSTWAAESATPARVLERHGCGWRIEPGDVAGMVRLLKRLEQDRGLVREAGAQAGAL